MQLFQNLFCTRMNFEILFCTPCRIPLKLFCMHSALCRIKPKKKVVMANISRISKCDVNNIIVIHFTRIGVEFHCCRRIPINKKLGCVLFAVALPLEGPRAVGTAIVSGSRIQTKIKGGVFKVVSQPIHHIFSTHLAGWLDKQRHPRFRSHLICLVFHNADE